MSRPFHFVPPSGRGQGQVAAGRCPTGVFLPRLFPMARFGLQLVLIPVALLLALGVTMLTSTSVFADDARLDVYVELRRHVVFLVIGLAACAFAAVLDYRLWALWARPFYIGACLLLVLCFVPYFGAPANGAWRWIGLQSLGLPGLRLQPSEVARYAIIFGLAAWFARLHSREINFRTGVVVPVLIAGLPIGLQAIAPDVGGAALIGAVVLGLIFVAGLSWRWVTALSLTAAAALTTAVLMIPNRMARLVAFTDLEASRLEFGLQQWRGVLALGSGGWQGMGLGSGRQKLFYMPFAHTDFVFPVVGEELGLVVTLLVVACFVAITVGGFMLAMLAPDRFGRLIGCGIVMALALQAIINIGVTTATLPNKGLPLPFVSYGGSNLVMCLFGIGILINLYRQGMETGDRGLPLLDRPKRSPRA